MWYVLGPVLLAIAIQVVLGYFWPVSAPAGEGAKAKKARTADDLVDSHAGALSRERARQDDMPRELDLRQEVPPHEEPTSEEKAAQSELAEALAGFTPRVVPASRVPDHTVQRWTRSTSEKTHAEERERQGSGAPSRPNVPQAEAVAFEGIPADFSLAEFSRRDD